MRFSVYGKNETFPPGRMCRPENFQGTEFARTIWDIKLPEDNEYEDLLVPKFWAHVKASLSPGDELFVMKSDMSWKCRGTIVATEPEVYVALEDKIVLSADVKLPDEFGVRYNVGARSFEIYRSADKLVMRKGFPTKELARNWLEDHISKTTVAAA